MAPKKLVSVGTDIYSNNIDSIDFNSNLTLLDWDIIVFRPDFSEMLDRSERYQGKISLDEHASFRLRERCEHWRREIKLAIDTGRTVIIYLDKLIEIFIDTGQRNYSGTGRNRHTTRIVDQYSNYVTIPYTLKPRNACGTSMKLSPQATALTEYWAAFGKESRFEVTLLSSPPKSSITTKDGDLLVGGVYGSESGGNLVALPMLDFYDDRFYSGDKVIKAGQVFGNRLVHSWIGIDSALRSETQVTAPPAWSEKIEYGLSSEPALRAKLIEAEKRLATAQKAKEKATDELKTAGFLRSLLFEKGPPLEKVIIHALTLLGFEAENYKDDESEFDVVFACTEGRLLGEAEGKDSKAISIEKLRQLAMNIHEDLQRDEVTAPAKGILFGNGYRLDPPQERGEQFTEKCVTSAISTGAGLVATVELFRAAQYVVDSGDQDYAKKCRELLIATKGIVQFPDTPLSKTPTDTLEISKEADADSLNA